MSLYHDLVAGREKLALIGLGYVGMPIAVAFARKVSVIGYDIDADKIRQYQNGIDPTKEVGDEAVQATAVDFTADPKRLREAKFLIVSVPTPVNEDRTPDLTPIESASVTVGQNLTEGSIVVYESTVYPGVTEEICVPILERESGLRCGVDFKVGYSPERINPGDKVHRLETITKIVSGMDAESLEIIAQTYELVVDAGVYRTESIQVAEAAKVIENSQRDINIAFMNELSVIFNRLNIDTLSVLEAAATKWNFLNFRPGLVGGHCIGVDPYYLTYRAEQTGYHSQIILAGRQINDSMGKYVAEHAVKKIIPSSKALNKARVAILGFTFKGNCPDTRNTKVIDIVDELREYGIEPLLTDAQADAAEVKKHYGLELLPLEDLTELDAMIIAVDHQEYANLDQAAFDYHFGKENTENRVVIDVKGLLDRKAMEEAGYIYWRL